MTVGYATFTVGDHRYLYDTTSNALVAIPPAAAELLGPFLRCGSRAAGRELAGGGWSAAELREATAFLHACRGRGMLRPMHRLDFLSVARPGELRRLYARGPRRVTLGITERCNQRCRYCPYVAGKGGPPRHADMSWEIARQSADLLLARSRRGSAPLLELFGGEPALDWPMVERIVRHVRETRRRRDARIVLYTNATLLDPPRLEHLVANEVILAVSLDGPPAVHDAERRLAGGAPTHGSVLRALRYLRRRHPAYLRRRVRVHCTFGLREDLPEVFRYFSRPAFRDLQVTFGYRSGDPRATEADIARHEAQLDTLDAWHLEALKGRRRAFHPGLYSSILGAVLGGVMHRTVGPTGKAAHPGRVCLPGQRRLFVSGSGSLHPCEHHDAPGSEIGDSRRGVDLVRAGAMLRDHARLCDRVCQGCWAWRLCSHCLLHSLDRQGRPTEAEKLESCRIEQEGILRALRRWVRLWRSEPAGAVRVKGSLRWAEAHPEE